MGEGRGGHLSFLRSTQQAACDFSLLLGDETAIVPQVEGMHLLLPWRALGSRGHSQAPAGLLWDLNLGENYKVTSFIHTSARPPSVILLSPRQLVNFYQCSSLPLPVVEV